ncbi:MAG: MFS transporter [Lentisphaerae bacterium]|nr:MFS transporter [Lentisphaerota bacterium]
MTYAETLSEKVRRSGRRYAYGACLFGCISEVMLDSSAIIIIFFTMLDGGDMLTMLGTSFTGILGALFYIPCSILITRCGLKKVVYHSCLAGCMGFMLIACAPFFGMAAAKYVALAGCLIYSFQRISYGAAWYPLLDVFLRPEDRAKFFGTMRFFYTGFTGTLFFIIGLIMQKNPPVMFLQMVIGCAGVLILGRAFCVSRFPDNLRDAPENPDVRKGLGIAMKNGPLTAYSIYVWMFTIAHASLSPLAYLYYRQYVQLNPGTVQIISTAGIAGLVTGYWCYSRKLGACKLKYLELFSHCIYIVAAFTLFFMDKSVPGFPLIAGCVMFSITFAASLFTCNNSAELLALARPGNKAMAMAFVQTYSSAGTAIGRTGTSLLLGTSMFAPVWEFYGREISRYQTFFLLSGSLMLILLFMLPSLPSFVPERNDYYEPKR